MKMRKLILFLPALMVLASCNAVQPIKNNIMLEDTTAHSEIFGSHDVVGGNLRVKERAKGDPISAPKIGYQLQYNSGTDMLAIRFVAAIKEFNVKAFWRRGVAGADGTELRSKSFANDGQEVTKYYTTLSDGTNTITAGSGDFVGYSGFVVYSLYNIPYTANKEAYVAAYVNLVGDEEGDDYVHNNSKALAVKIEKETDFVSKNTFVFDPTMNKHFLEGTIGGVLYNGGEHGLYEESGYTPDGNHAWYENVSLQTTDSFGSFYYDHDRIFQFFGRSVYFAESSSYFNNSSLGEFNSPKEAGTHTLFVSNGSLDASKTNHVYTEKDGASHAFNVTVPDWTGNDSVVLFASIQRTNKIWYWVPATLTNSTTLTFNAPDNITHFLLVRCKSGTSTPNWSETGDNSGRIYSKCGDVTTNGGYSYSITWSNYPA